MFVLLIKFPILRTKTLDLSVFNKSSCQEVSLLPVPSLLVWPEKLSALFVAVTRLLPLLHSIMLLEGVSSMFIWDLVCTPAANSSYDAPTRTVLPHGTTKKALVQWIHYVVMCYVHGIPPFRNFIFITKDSGWGSIFSFVVLPWKKKSSPKAS